jgi:hypothetical protein
MVVTVLADLNDLAKVLDILQITGIMPAKVPILRVVD